MVKTPNFSRTYKKDFTVELKKRVNNYFKDNDIPKHANAAMVFKSIFHLSIWVGSYLLILLGDFSYSVTLLLWAVLGFFISQVSVNIGHDAIHGAYSSKKWINDLLSHTFNINGASAYMWKKMHNTAHHTFTNIDGFDEDIDAVPILRMSPNKKLRKIHRIQHIYAFLFYGLATISWVFVKDYVKFFANKVGNYGDQKHPAKEYFYLFFYKFINYTIFLIIPMLVIDQPWHQILIGYLIMHYVSGFSLAFIFMLAHAVEVAHFPVPDQKGGIETSWFAHQLYTTTDFAPRNFLAGFLTGGLNQQVEHHLFPNICSCHYSSLSPIVKQTAEEFGLPYHEYSFGKAVKSHFNFLRKMGSQENYVPENI